MTSASGRISFAVGRTPESSRRPARAPTAANSPRLWVRPRRRISRTGTTSASPSGDATLRASVAAGCRSPSSVLADSRASSCRPIVSQTASAASIRPGSSSTGPLPDEAERRGLAGRERDAVRLDAAEARERAHARVVLPAAGAADGDERRPRRRPPAPASRLTWPAPACADSTRPPAAAISPREQIAWRHRARHRPPRGIAPDADAARGPPPAARPPRPASRAWMRVRRSPARASGDRRHGVGARRQHAVAGRHRRDDLRAIAAHDHDIERRDRVGAGGNRLADVDARRRAGSGAGA